MPPSSLIPIAVAIVLVMSFPPPALADIIAFVELSELLPVLMSVVLAELLPVLMSVVLEVELPELLMSVLLDPELELELELEEVCRH